MRTAIEGWAALVLKTEGDGDYKAAKAYAEKNGIVRTDLDKDLKIIEKANIPVDIRFKQGEKILGVQPMEEPVKVIQPIIKSPGLK